jgi:type I restriction enzyme S subunit
LAKVKEILKRFRQSVLAAAYSGKLNAEKTQLGDHRKRKLKDVVNSIQIGPFGSLLHKSDYVPSEIPVINPTNIVDGKINPSPKVTIHKLKKCKLERYVLKEGDLIVGRRGEMGRCAVVTKEEDGWICGTGSLSLRPGTELMPYFLQILISSPQVVAYLEDASVGSTMTNLNQKIFSNMEIPVPPKEVQNQIVKNCQSLLRTAERMETRCRKSEGLLERLERRILAKAFRGELVPTEAELAQREGRPYEPASSFLTKTIQWRKDFQKTRKGKRRKK